MQLDQYISDLLYRYECVILPEFGAFLTQLQSAQVHSSTNAFYPPKKKLSFNRQLIDNDGLLANYISKTEMIPYEEATMKIASYVRYLYDGLHKGESQTLQNIGSLSLDEENKLHFEPSYHLNYLTSSFGLSSFTSSQVLREVYKEEVKSIEATTPIVFTPERRNSNWLKYAAAAVVILGVSGILGYTYLRDVEEFNYASKQEASIQLEDKIQEATFVIENPLPAITLAVSKPTGKYHIVAGAFRQEENAQTRVSQLREKGYKARQIGINRYGLHQVVYGSFTDSDEAINMLRKIRKEDNSSAWLLVQKIK
ncbi:SPOR domain-containing protein [Dokdonia sp. Hel_I_53]|uniref:HU domain-containing protein n=1 Tax=Dokdonia sp. Hel_I_53 TaxID=1566287 RepID=UPI00119A2CD2|nr:SPOR domain-containing protein [Dokdonia sp. Hel_I_53]TVZ52741.1 sporulation related protein [Dokdonia sp. Hel_I_53]